MNSADKNHAPSLTDIRLERIGVACYEKEMKNSIDKWSKIKYFIIKEYMTIYNNTSCMKSI